MFAHLPRILVVGLLFFGPSSFATAQVLQVTEDGEASGDLFGRSAAGLGDLDGDAVLDWIVGARDHDTAGLGSGRVYLYSGSDSSLIGTLDGEAAGDAFGVAVADAGLVDSDSFPDFLVGARTADTSALDTGRAYLYSGVDRSLIRQFDGEAAGDRFGWAVAGVGDVDGDGYDDALVGAPRHANAGRVYLYSGFDGALLLQFDGEGAGHHFGLLLAAAGDVDGDSYADLAIGAPLHDALGVETGRAYVYSGFTGTLIDTFTGSGPFEQLGSAISCVGDLNTDGYDDVLVGSFRGGASFEGTALVYSGADGSVLHSFTGEDALDAFGSTLNGVGDVNGDGAPDFLIGANGFEVPESKTGRAYLYSGSDGSLLYHFEGEAVADRFGISVAGVGDTDQDGLSDVMVGAYLHEENGLDNSGRVYVYKGNDLFLDASPRTVSVGETLTFTTGQGVTGLPAILFLTGVDGIPLFRSTSVFGAFDGNGQWILSGPVPPDPTLSAGIDLSFRVLALGGAGNILETADEIVSFQ